jgi:hypothetical protein
MILDGVMTGLVNALIIAIAAYLILNFMFGFETYASLLIALMPAILIFALVTLIYFKRPWYMIHFYYLYLQSSILGQVLPIYSNGILGSMRSS